MNEQLEIATAYFNIGRLDDCERICNQVLTGNPAEPWALCMLAGVANARKAHSRALEYVGRAVSAGVNLAELFVEEAIGHAGMGAAAPAFESAQRAVALSPNVRRGYHLVSQFTFPGENHYSVLRWMHERLKPRNYVEIGVATGTSIMLTRSPTIAVGIDPEPRLVEPPKAVCKIFPLTSDAYFASRDLKYDIESDSVDFVLLDGLHLFEQTLRDFINIERFSGPHTVVAIHDCLPVDALTAARERQTYFWSGDVWKVPLCLHELRTDLDLLIIPTPPSGLCIVSGLDPASTVLTDRFDQVVNEYVSLDLAAAAERRRTIPSTPNRWPDIEGRLAVPRRSR